MNELERRLRTAVHANASAATDARAPREIKRAVARRRGLTASTLGAAAAVIIGSVAVGGLGPTEGTEPPTLAPTPDLSVDDGSRAYATVPLPEHSQFHMTVGRQGEQWCGLAPPQPNISEDNFSASFDVPAEAVLDRSPDMQIEPQSAAVSLTYSDTGQLPVFAGGLTALLVEDHVVVGYVEEYQSPAVIMFDVDQTRTHHWDWTGWITSCGDDGAAPPSPLPPGEYDAVFITRVHNDLATAAQWSLHLDNYVLPAAANLEAYREGSFYCQQWQMEGENAPLTCSPNAVVGFDLDEEAGTATVPYDPSYYLRDVDITFATESIPVTVVGEDSSHYFMPPDPVYQPGGEIMCGDFYSQVEYGQPPLTATWPAWADLPEPGDSLGAALWVWDFDWETAQVTPPHNPRVWLTRNKEVTEGSTDDGASYYHGHEVVGWVDTESVTVDPVELFIFDGPRDWPLTTTDAQWCDGYDTSGPGSPIADFGFLGLIATPATVTLDDGSTNDNATVSLQTGYFN